MAHPTGVEPVTSASGGQSRVRWQIVKARRSKGLNGVLTFCLASKSTLLRWKKFHLSDLILGQKEQEIFSRMTISLNPR